MRGVTSAWVAVIAILPLTGCVVIEDAPRAEPGSSAPSATLPSTAPTSDTPSPSKDEGEGAGEAGGDKLPEREGDIYAYSVQRFSPYLERWAVDGSAVTYDRIDCLGQVSTTTGTWGEDNRITWDGGNPFEGVGPTSKTLMKERTSEGLARSGKPEVATPDVDGQIAAHVDKCIEAGETVGGVLLN